MVKKNPRFKAVDGGLCAGETNDFRLQIEMLAQMIFWTRIHLTSVKALVACIGRSVFVNSDPWQTIRVG